MDDLITDMTWKFAYGRAWEIKNQLTPFCKRLTIAGSVRRRVATPKDIEIVAEPLFSPSLFGDPHENLVVVQLRQLAKAGTITPRINRSGHRIAWFDGGYPCRFVAMFWDGIAVDLFMSLPDRADWWGYLLWLRTGPGSANRLMVTKPINGGLRPEGIKMANGRVLRDGKPIRVPDEETMFNILELGYVMPKNRSVGWYKAMRLGWHLIHE